MAVSGSRGRRRAAFWLTWIALGSGALTFIAWLVAGASTSTAVERLVTVLVIACPHALGLAVPLVLAISTTLGAQNGLLVRDRKGLENARLLTTVVFDKTGTLTLGAHRVVGAMSSGTTMRCVWPPRWSAMPSIPSGAPSSRAPVIAR